MKNTRYYLVEMEQRIIAAVVVTKLALLKGFHEGPLDVFYCHEKKMNQNSTIIFVCEHGAAKSSLAAAHFNKLASEKRSNLRAIARGTNPDAELSLQTVKGLLEDGLHPTESAPQKLTVEDIESAQLVIAFCELPIEYEQQANVERWEDIPPVSENYERARDAIIERVRRLLHSAAQA